MTPAAMIPLLLAVATATTSLSVSSGARVHPVSDTTAVRTQVGLTLALWSAAPYSLVSELELSFATARRGFVQGDVRLFLVSGTLAVEARHDFAVVSIGIGPRFEIGWGLAQGRAAARDVEEESGRALILTASVGLSFRVPLLDAFGMTVLAEAGDTIRGLEAVVDGRQSAGWRGAFISATAGLWLEL